MGIIAGTFLLSKEIALGIAVIAMELIYEITLVVFAQSTLIITDIENNTRQITEESVITNAMLTETLGTILVNINKTANKENKS